MTINGIIDLDNGELLEATGKHRISALDIQGSETAKFSFTFYQDGKAVTDNSVLSGAVIEFGVKADADYTGTSYKVYHNTFSASSDGLTYTATPTWATSEVESALGNSSSVKLHGQVKIVISGITYYSQVFEVEIHNDVIQAAGETSSVIFPRLITSTSDPTATDDIGDGYGVSSTWLNTSSNAVHVLMDNTEGAAVWAGFLALSNGAIATDLLLADNVKAIFGTSSDGIEIYHASDESYIDDSGTGRLFIRSNGSGVFLQKTDGENLAKFKTDGAAELYFDGSKKIESTSLGATISGKLIVNGDLEVSTSGSITHFQSTTTQIDDPVLRLGENAANDNFDRGVEFLYNDGSAKVGFFGYDDSQDAFTFLTDATNNSEVFSGTAGNLNIGNIKTDNGSASFPSHSFTNDFDSGMYFTSGTLSFAVDGARKGYFTSAGFWSDANVYHSPTGAFRAYGYNAVVSTNSGYEIIFKPNDTEAARFDSSGNFLIGNSATMSTANAQRLVVGDGAGAEGITIYSGTDNSGFLYFADGTSSSASYRGALQYNHTNDTLTFDTAASNRMTLNSTGLNLPDDVKLNFGNDADLKFSHTGGLGLIENETGDLYITNYANDSDMFFRNDDGSGGVTNYLKLNGSGGYIYAYKNILFGDDVKLKLGTSGDGVLYSTNSHIIYDHYNIDVLFRHFGNDKDIIFQTTTGGSQAELLRLDGSASSVNIPDDVRLKIGTGSDLQLQHSSGHSYLESSTGHLYVNNHGTGDTKFSNFTNDTDIIFSTSTGGAMSELMRLDGSASSVNIPDDVRLQLGTGADLRIQHSSGNSSAYIQNYTGDIYLQNNATDKDFVFSTSPSGVSTELMRLDGSTSRIGIGTTSPVGKLTIIDATSSSTAQKFHVGRGNGAGLYITDTDDSSYIKAIQDEDEAGYGNLILAADSAGNKDGFISFESEGEKMRIAADGNVGIGTTSPNSKLEIQGPAISSGTPVDLKHFNAQTLSLATSAYYGSFANFWVGRYADVSNHGKSSLTISLNDGLYNSDNQSADTDVMTLLASGNVGIGTDSPQALVDIAGSHDGATAEWQNLAIGSDAAGWIDTNDGIGRIDFYGRHTHGTGGTLEVGASIVALADANWNGGAGTAYGRLEFMTADGGAPTTRMTILDHGNVGIGVTAPVNKVQVDYSPATAIGSLTATAGTASTNWNRNAGLLISGASVSNGLALGVSSTPNTFAAWLQSGHPDTAGQNVGTISLNPLGGNVGIGTASPSRKLSVAGALELTTADTTLNTANACIRRGNSGEMFLDATGDVTVTIDTNDNNTDRLFNVRKDTSTELFRIQEDGNVGISETSPASKCTVTGGDFETTTASKGLILKTPDGSNRYRITVDNSGNLVTTQL